MLSVICFLIGVQLMIELLAATYRIVDLWYCLKDYWLSVAWRLAMVGVSNTLLVYLLPDHLATAVIMGQLLYLGLHTGKFILIRAAIYLIEAHHR